MGIEGGKDYRTLPESYQTFSYQTSSLHVCILIFLKQDLDHKPH